MVASYLAQGGNMAIFSRKQNAKKVDEPAKVIVDDSLGANPVEEPPSNLQAQASASTETVAPSQPAEASATSSVTVEQAAAASQPVDSSSGNGAAHDEIEPEAIVTPPVAAIEHRFGIDDAIQLMRSLPSDPNTPLVVRVVRVTLGAVKVSVEEIVQDAFRKEERIKEKIAGLEGQIAELEKQLGSLRREIASHQADLKETVSVRERLHLADQYPTLRPPPTPPSIVTARSSSTKPVTP
jgi:hypothetical protein